jgi:hypothetical protein
MYYRRTALFNGHEIAIALPPLVMNLAPITAEGWPKTTLNRTEFVGITDGLHNGCVPVSTPPSVMGCTPSATDGGLGTPYDGTHEMSFGPRHESNYITPGPHVLSNIANRILTELG